MVFDRLRRCVVCRKKGSTQCCSPMISIAPVLPLKRQRLSVRSL